MKKILKKRVNKIQKIYIIFTIRKIQKNPKLLKNNNKIIISK